MSRSISVWYTDAVGRKVTVDVEHADLLGCQRYSMSFWSLPIHRQIGVERLADLGHLDPVWFTGWRELTALDNEIALLEQTLADIPFDDKWNSRWVGNLRTCLEALKAATPAGAVPEFMVG